MAKPRSIQQPPAYLTRHVFRFVDPTGFSADQWRLIAREPVNRMAQRFIVRELSALQWTITSDRRDDPRVDEYAARWDEIFEDGDGFATWLSRMLEDVCSLPFGGASEVGYRGEDLDWALHVDAATLYPTYERRVPYVQVNPDDATQRVYFKRGQLRRLRVNPRPDIRFKEYQVSPTEDGFLPIEALSKIYLYYMQQLLDTPPMGFLDVPGWDEDEAVNWARNFREMIEGTDPIKIPIIYDHMEGPANWIPFGRSPSDLNIPEQFKRFAEMLLGKYGLSIGDLRLFEHESTKAGERVSQLVTERSGIGFWAALIEAFINRLLPDGLTFQFKQPRPERELTVANRKALQMTMLREAAGGKALISVEDAVEEAQALELFQTEVKPLDEEQAQPPPFGGNGRQGPPELPGGRPEEELDQEADQDLAKAFIEKQLGRWRNPEPPAAERLAALVRGAFEQSGENVDAGQVGEIAETVERTLEPLEIEIETEVKAEVEIGLEKGGPGSGFFGHAGRPGQRGGSATAGGGKTPAKGSASYEPGGVYDDAEARFSTTYANDVLNHGVVKDWELADEGLRADIKTQIVEDLADATGLSEPQVNAALATWSQSSNDKNPHSLALQKAASEEFGVSLSSWQEDLIKEVGLPAEGVVSLKERLGFESTSLTSSERHDLLRHSYAMTQEAFSNAGVERSDTIRLYRGIRMPEADPRTGSWKKGDVFDYNGNAIESWSASPNIARDFGRALMMDVPVKNIVSSARTGLGCLSEGEFIILGSIPGQRVEVID